MNNSEKSPIQKEMLDSQQQFLQDANESFRVMNHLINETNNDYELTDFQARIIREKNKKTKKQEVEDFVNSLFGSDVSMVIMGEWNVIRNDIRDYLFHAEFDYDIITGGCPNIKAFVQREKDHLISIKGKVGKISIEYQMLSAIIAQAVVLYCEFIIICVEPVKKQRIHTASILHEEMVFQRTLKDCLNALDIVSSFDLEYQYRYEIFSPTYKYFSELGQKTGLEEKIEMPPRQKTGCMGVVVLSILLSTTLIILI